MGYVALPGAAQRFRGGGLFLDSHRVGGAYAPANQSLRGLILRLDPSLGSTQLLGLAAIVGIVGVALAVCASRRGDEAMGFSVCAVTGLLVSPVSWTHHWALAVPALLLIGVRVVRRRSTLAIAAAGAVGLVGYSYLPKLMAKPAFAPGHRVSVVRKLASAPYVLIGLAGLGLACIHESRLLVHTLPSKRPMPRPSFALPDVSPS